MTPREAHHLIATLLEDLSDCIECGKTAFPWEYTNEEKRMNDRLHSVANALRERAKKQPMTLLYAAKDREINHAAVLRDIIQE